MPLYEYECSKGHRFEKIESYSAKTVQKCPKCGARAERLLAAPAIQFKGSGWYVTDYAGKKQGSSSGSGESQGDGASSNSPAGKSPEKTGEKTSEKPAEKPAAAKSVDKGSEKRKR
ncbi:MAG TPA: zinc ribbon domain-containing protein [Verrucomicrobiae bacterium]|nr:zinc ribbon domain-containing protein [Verrucomicrobiae bacterium]